MPETKESLKDMEEYESLGGLCDLELEESILCLDDETSIKGKAPINLIFSEQDEKKKSRKPTRKRLKRSKRGTRKVREESKRGLKKKRKSDSALNRSLNSKIIKQSNHGGAEVDDVSSDAQSVSSKGKEEKIPYIPWSEVEDQKLKNIVERKIIELKTDEIPEPDNTNTFPWSSISLRMPGRTPKQCRERWRNKLNPRIKQTPWTIEEDITLMDMHSRLGNRWVLLASMLPGRTENSVKTRFKSIFRARRRAWRPEEDSEILKLYNRFGGKWAEIASNLPNRTANGVKVRLRHLMSGNEEKPPEPGSPSQSFGVTLPEVIKRNEMYLKKFLEEEGYASLRKLPKQRVDKPTSDIPPSRLDTPESVTWDFFNREQHGLDTQDVNLVQTKNGNSEMKRSKGTRALIMDELQKDEDIGSSFANAIANILSPFEKPCVDFMDYEKLKLEPHSIDMIPQNSLVA